ncbi:MAG TPA: glutamate-5-semialdehyde dehydrogenase, partial [Thiothrix sp.]|nr:glutamate-5-semialdehyde dehydrogenase [Thiothrix sp.]
MNVAKYIKRISVTAKSAAVELATATTEQKNNALHAIADALMARQQWLQQENDKDLHIGKTKGLDAAMLDRLMLNVERITAMAEGLRQVATLAEPIGGITDMEYRPNGLQIGRMRVPLGVIGIIYESRPNVTADAAALCLKSGNATILRGGSEAIHSNQAIADCIQAGLEQVGLSKTCVQVIKTTDRAAVGELLRAKDTVDVIIPRGGKGLIQRVSDESLIPVIKHLDGICHVYVDETADLDKAVKVALNAKTHRYGVCNAMETLLVAEGIANDFLPVIADKLMAKEVELRGCAKTTAILTGLTDCKLATEADWA